MRLLEYTSEVSLACACVNAKAYLFLECSKHALVVIHKLSLPVSVQVCA